MSTESHENVRTVVALAIGLLLVLAVVLLIAGVLRSAIVGGPLADEPDDPARSAAQLREPKLQTDPAAELSMLLRHADSVLSTYGVVDSGGGIFHIPIDSAMSILASREQVENDVEMLDSIIIPTESGYSIYRWRASKAVPETRGNAPNPAATD